jgi:hypothetical protein
VAAGVQRFLGEMTATGKTLTCRRCGRLVVISRDQFDVFEQMHYVCFHYEFEHDPADPDEDCGVVGCPSGILPPVVRQDVVRDTLMREVVDAIAGSQLATEALAFRIEPIRPGAALADLGDGREYLVAVIPATNGDRHR